MKSLATVLRARAEMNSHFGASAGRADARRCGAGDVGHRRGPELRSGRAPLPRSGTARWLCCPLLTYRPGYSSSLAPRQRAWGPASKCEFISARALRTPIERTRADLNPRESAPIRILIMSLLKRLTVRDIFSAGRRKNPGRRFFQPNDGRAWRARMARGCRLNANDTSSFRQPPVSGSAGRNFFSGLPGSFREAL